MDIDSHHTTVKLEEMTHSVQVHDATRSNSLSMTHVGSMSDGLSDEPSSPESTTFDDSDLLTTAGTLYTFYHNCLLQHNAAFTILSRKALEVTNHN